MNNLIIFFTGATLYPLIEFAWRGYSHYSMAIAGGLCLVLINIFCCNKFEKSNLILRCTIGSIIITSVELVIGFVFNILLLMEVWDYSKLPLNFLGQISLPFSVVWFFITIPAMYICEKSTEISIIIKQKVLRRL